MRWLLAVALFGCAHRPTDVEQQAACQKQLDGGTSVSYRELHPRCGDLMRIHAPITDEAAFREAFPCETTAIDFTKERVDVISFWESDGNDILSNLVLKQGRALMLVLSPVHCNGLHPGHGWNIIVVPRDLPPISTVRCSIGRCPDRDLPPA
jgi:hypothetical protein